MRLWRYINTTKLQGLDDDSFVFKIIDFFAFINELD